MLKGKTETTEKMLQVLVETAKELGYDLTEEDFRDYAEKQVKAGEAETSEKVREISDEEVEQISGGNDSFGDSCKEVFTIAYDYWSGAIKKLL